MSKFLGKFVNVVKEVTVEENDRIVYTMHFPSHECDRMFNIFDIRQGKLFMQLDPPDDPKHLMIWDLKGSEAEVEQNGQIIRVPAICGDGPQATSGLSPSTIRIGNNTEDVIIQFVFDKNPPPHLRVEHIEV